MARRLKSHVVGGALFAFGLILGTMFFASAVWADIEAFLFDASLGADAALTTLRCPMVLTAGEVGEVSATFKNPLDRAIQPGFHFHVTDGYVSLMREEAGYLQLAPGETKRLSWQVTPQDAAWDTFILVRVFVQRSYPLPSRTSTCGILSLDSVALSGNRLVALVIASTASLLGFGYTLWEMAHRPLEGPRLQEARGRVALMVLVGLGTVMGMTGWWLPGLLCLIVLVLLVVVMLARSAAGGPGPL